MNAVIELMEAGEDMMTDSKNTKSPKESSTFNQAIVLFLGQWAIISIALIIYVLLK
jgi:hypothetical protein